jgi:hypothetical protein
LVAQHSESSVRARAAALGPLQWCEVRVRAVAKHDFATWISGMAEAMLDVSALKDILGKN